jgi:hypothetical protein
VVLSLFAAGYYFLFFLGPRVRVFNDSQEHLEMVSVFVKDREAVIGALAPGESRSVRVLPTRESAVDIMYADSQNRISRVTVDCHIEPFWYGGTIEVVLQGDANAEVRDGSWYLFPGKAAKPATHTKGITVQQRPQQKLQQAPPKAP